MTTTNLGYVKSTILEFMADGKEHNIQEIREYLESKIGGELIVGNYIASALGQLSKTKKGCKTVLRNPQRGIYVKSRDDLQWLLEDNFTDSIKGIESLFKSINVLSLTDAEYDLMVSYLNAFRTFKDSIKQLQDNQTN